MGRLGTRPDQPREKVEIDKKANEQQEKQEESLLRTFLF